MKGGDDSKGTLIYCAPEMLVYGKKFDKKIDSWSMGVILHEMLTGCLPFEDNEEL